MARLSIEESWWTDPRRSALIRRLGGECAADSCAIHAWRLAQEFWKHEQGLVPKHLFDLLEGAEDFVAVGLAEVRESFVYVRGSSAYLDWVRQQREQASMAGKKSAESRRKKSGTAQPGASKAKNPRTTPERASNGRRTELNDAEPSDSVSYSVSKEIIPFATQTGVALPRQAPDGGETVALWVRAYQEKYRVRYAFQKRDFGMLKNFGAQHSHSDVATLFACYLAIDEPFYSNAKHPLSLFFRDLQKISVAAQTGIDPSKPKPMDYSFLKE